MKINSYINGDIYLYISIFARKDNTKYKKNKSTLDICHANVSQIVWIIIKPDKLTFILKPLLN